MNLPWLESLFGQRFCALFQKEMRQILRDRQLLFMLVFPPTFQLLLYGYALSPDVHDLRLAISDQSNSPISRELISAVVENKVFVTARTDGSERDAVNKVKEGKVEAALIIPPEFNRRIKNEQGASVQILLDGVDANTSGIAAGYLTQMIGQFSRTFEPPEKTEIGRINPQISFLYNPGLISAWFFIPGVMGLVLNLTGSLVSTSTLLREKDSGTLEQLVMTPASSLEVLLAKILPLFALLIGNVCLALAVGKFLFNIPFRGNPVLFFTVRPSIFSLPYQSGLRSPPCPTIKDKRFSHHSSSICL